MSDFLQRLKTEILIGPGPVPTNLAEKGFDQLGNSTWWAINHPDIYQDLVKAFFNAGCDIAPTITSPANRLRLRMHGLEDKTREINYQILKLTKEVTPSNCYVICTLTSSANFLPPIGNVNVEEVFESYVEQVLIAEDVGVDLFLVISDIEQVQIAINAIRDHSKLPIMGLLSFNPTPKGPRTMMGTDPRTGAEELQEFGADIIGQICGETNYEETTAILREMSEACSKYLCVRPNAGSPELVDGKTVHPATPEQMAKEAPNWVKAGARIVAGCCGTTPEHLAKVVAALK